MIAPVPAYVWAFAAFTVPFVATPGASTAVVLRNSVAGGVRSGVATALGVNAGSVFYGMLTAFGVSMALQHVPSAWLAMRFAGVAYLAWLGARSLWRAVSPRAGDGRMTPGVVNAARPEDPAFVSRAREGFLTNALNPSIATFYLLVMPQFIPVDAPFVRTALALTAVHVTLALTWHLTWAVAGGTLAVWLGRSRPRRILEGLTGAALLALAVRLLM